MLPAPCTGRRVSRRAGTDRLAVINYASGAGDPAA